MKGIHTAYIALGSNLGDRLANLQRATELLNHSRQASVARVAPTYETEPMGVREQPWFLNTVVEIRTDLDPLALLKLVKEVEASIGRTVGYRWGPREIDVDILFYDEVRWQDETLTVPHPRIAERLFVLMPLRDLLPEWRDAEGTPIGELVERLQGTAEVRLHEDNSPQSHKGHQGAQRKP